ncbi:MAG: S9 family peptidase [Betaproteobacteria bacterium]|jgi:dipeptidyl aminopeptidase/acylaminoacyl peptidase|nr:S9 family peptidase [Betaproteobacteria bacterium]
MKTAPYGEWESPITAAALSAASVRFSGVAIDGADVYWVEGRPAERGRNVLVRRTPDGAVVDVTPAPYDVRSRVHEYGGGAFAISGGRVWFSHFGDGRIYRQSSGKAPEPLTPDGPFRYADIVFDAKRNRLLCVRESHADPAREPVNELVAIDCAGGAVSVLATGHDFYSSPRASPDGQRLAWLTWDHPNMPWDGTELWVAGLDDADRPTEPARLAGGKDQSVFQPEWGPDGNLYLVSDPDGWWNLYCHDGERLSCLCRTDHEFGRPQWQFGQTTYGIESGQRILCAFAEEGVWRLGAVHQATGQLEVIPTQFTDISAIAIAQGRAAVIAASPWQASVVALIDPDTGKVEVLRGSVSIALGEEYISPPESVTFQTGAGQHAHAFWYAPRNPHFRAPDGERPPLIVIGHGGPTGATTPSYSLATQYWTTRGFAVLDVNYRGSTGYGRAYRELLRGLWGIADVEDCVDGAMHLVSQGRADENRLAIRGGSAGGFTALAALTFYDAFSAGASYYGIGDLEALARDTHKFESRYTDSLVGPYPERKDLYEARSPIHCVDRLSCPVIFFQGLEDKVVPPSQAQAMVDALRAKGLPVAYLAFEGEQHGFRRAETIIRAREAELYFYGKVFGFTPADKIEPVPIENIG